LIPTTLDLSSSRRGAAPLGASPAHHHIIVQGSGDKALISRAKQALALGKGWMGIWVETTFSGGNSFALFNGRFFTPALAALDRVYPSWKILMERVPVDLQASMNRLPMIDAGARITIG
jgi:hypothetical protein